MSAPPDFVVLSEIYPNVGNETYAFKAWLGAMRDDTPMKIIEGTKRYRTWWLEEGTSAAFIPTLAKFLRERRYRTDPGPSKAKKTWTPPAPPSKRWSAQEADEPKVSKPLSVAPYEHREPPKGFRSAAEILASRQGR